MDRQTIVIILMVVLVTGIVIWNYVDAWRRGMRP